MVNDDIVTLIAEIAEGKEEKTDVFAEISSVGQAEFFSAAQIGFKAEMRLSVRTEDYEGQTLVIVKHRRYAIYRTYMKDNGKTELYLTDRLGIRN